MKESKTTYTIEVTLSNGDVHTVTVEDPAKAKSVRITSEIENKMNADNLTFNTTCTIKVMTTNENAFKDFISIADTVAADNNVIISNVKITCASDNYVRVICDQKDSPVFGMGIRSMNRTFRDNKKFRDSVTFVFKGKNLTEPYVFGGKLVAKRTASKTTAKKEAPVKRAASTDNA